MKAILLISIGLIALSNKVISQCPQSALKIQSPLCDPPRNLRVNDIKCITMQLNWQGNKNGKYVVEATGTDDAANTLFEIKDVEYTCNETGNCSSSISVKEGARVNWSVQSICNINGAVIYSPKAEGKEIIIPYCQAAASPITDNDKINSETLHVFPNPTTGKLTLQYTSSTSGNIQIVVYDMAGREAFTRADMAVKGTNTYQLNLPSLTQGSYYVQLNNGNERKRVKFIIQR